MKSLLIVYHSMTDGTRQMAAAAVSGALGEAASVRARLLHACLAGPDDLLAAEAYLFATPENLASMSGLMKDFFDRSYYAVLDRIEGRPYATMVCAGSDGRNAARQIERIATGWRLKQVAEPLIVCTQAQTTEQILRHKWIAPADLARCTELGGALAAGLALGVF
jgi:multimeric flavodoxin WrbA